MSGFGLGVHPQDLDFSVEEGAGVDQGLFDRKVGIAQLHVLAYDRDFHRAVRVHHAVHEASPVLQITAGSLKVQALDNVVAQPGIFEQGRHFVDAADRRHRDDGAPLDVAEQGDLVARLHRHGEVAAAENDVGLNTHAPQLLDGMRWASASLYLARSRDVGQVGDVDRKRIVRRLFAPHLADRLEEHLAFDVTDRAADFDDHDLSAGAMDDAPDARLDPWVR